MGLLRRMQAGAQQKTLGMEMDDGGEDDDEDDGASISSTSGGDEIIRAQSYEGVSRAQLC